MIMKPFIFSISEFTENANLQGEVTK
jgi:hypothetical protein